MGSSPSKGNKPITVDIVEDGEPTIPTDYPVPAPPRYYIDIKSPHHSYNHEQFFDDDGLPWSDVLNKPDADETVLDGQIKNKQSSSKGRTGRPVVKQPPPSVARPIRSITLARDHERNACRQVRYPDTVQRSPSLQRKSTSLTFASRIEVDFSFVDKHAVKATKSHQKSYDGLFEYLFEPIIVYRFQEIYKVRSLLIWLVHQKPKKSITKSDDQTPAGLLYQIAAGIISYAHAFMTLCRHSGLPCLVIKGLSKSFDYIPSDTASAGMEDSWNAVYCEGSWQLVHPEKIKKIKDGLSDKENVKCDQFLSDDFFMPEPIHFIHTHLPDEDNWQLLPDDKVIKTLDAFLTSPCIFPPFFKFGFKLEPEIGGVVSSENGRCVIDLICSHRSDRNLYLIGYLTIIGNSVDRKSTDEQFKRTLTDLKHFVLITRQNQRFRIEVTHPVQGKYKLELFGNFYGYKNLKLCQFTILCDRTLQNPTYLPFPTNAMMWGPGKVSDDAGLLVPSQMVGIIVVPPNNAKEREGAMLYTSFQTLKIRFLLQARKTEGVDFFAYLIRAKRFNTGITEINGAKQKKQAPNNMITDNADDEKFYANFVSCEKDRNNQVLQITVRLPHEGDFGVMITRKQFRLNKNRKKLYYGAQQARCAYFLRASRYGHGDSVHQRLAREHMVSLIYGENLKDLQEAIEKCRKALIGPNDADVFNAERWCEFLQYKANLSESIHRRNIRIIDDTLTKVATFRYKMALQAKITLLFKIRQQLVQLRSLKDRVSTLEIAAHELAQVVDPEPEVHVTMAAVLLMFGELEKKIEDWSYIRKQLELGQRGEQPQLIKKLHFVADICPSKSVTKKVMSLLHRYNVDEIHAINQWASHFHVWALKVMSVFEDSTTSDKVTFPEAAEDIRTDTNTVNQPVTESEHQENDSTSGLFTRMSQANDVRYRTATSYREDGAFNTVFENRGVIVHSPEFLQVDREIQTD